MSLENLEILQDVQTWVFSSPLTLDIAQPFQFTGPGFSLAQVRNIFVLCNYHLLYLCSFSPLHSTPIIFISCLRDKFSKAPLSYYGFYLLIFHSQFTLILFLCLIFQDSKSQTSEVTNNFHFIHKLYLMRNCA